MIYIHFILIKPRTDICDLWKGVGCPGTDQMFHCFMKTMTNIFSFSFPSCNTGEANLLQNVNNTCIVTLYNLTLSGMRNSLMMGLKEELQPDKSKQRKRNRITNPNEALPLLPYSPAELVVEITQDQKEEYNKAT